MIESDTESDDITKWLNPIIEQLRLIHDKAVIAYSPLVEEICSRVASRNEVEWMLDWLLMYAGDERMLKLYKRVCREYFQTYP